MYRERILKGTNPNYTDFISELLQLLKCFGSVTGYKSAALPKAGREARVEVTVSLSELGERFGTGAADVGRAAHASVCSWGVLGTGATRAPGIPFAVLLESTLMDLLANFSK